ncbi:vacuole membrane protein 1 isoform X1 [Argonauta hians]
MSKKKRINRSNSLSNAMESNKVMRSKNKNKNKNSANNAQLEPPLTSPQNQRIGGGRSSSSGRKQRRLEHLKMDRKQLVLWRRPLQTTKYFLFEVWHLLSTYTKQLFQRKLMVLAIILILILLSILYNLKGPHQPYLAILEKTLFWYAYWVGLGFLSSVGLGTGLHTFVLYLGPHIALVTLAAFECMSVDFPEPPYPSKIICPSVQSKTMSIWMIMSKVRMESIMWGAGTAIGELPPYFMAKTSRLSGSENEEEELGELEELVRERNANPGELGFLDRAKVGIHNMIKKVGFWGILACASIPNPLFDLAGILCGHFLIPFWTFFGATLIGKAIIKMHIQKLFVIFLFSEHHMDQAIKFMKFIPFIGPYTHAPFMKWLEEQKNKLHNPNPQTSQGTNPLSYIFEKAVLIMVAYFMLSIINSMAQNYHKRMSKSKNRLED